MKVKRKKYSPFKLGSAGFMILALLWLTISAPFVNAGQQKMAKFSKSVNSGKQTAGNEEESSKPFSNSEEKTPSSSSFSEEYLHDHHESDFVLSVVSKYHKSQNDGTYIAFHGELLVPPPNAA